MTSFHDYEVVIGLECHIQLSTKTKLFSPAPNHYGDAPNTNVDVVDLGLPGVLPVLNAQAVEYALRLGSALQCAINHRSVFARKHYFYPDLPKGYQISQYDLPICGPGKLRIELDNGEEKWIGIHRIHIEEDAGKNIHVEGGTSSYVDYNRAGTPLLEVVTDPDMRSAEEAMAVFRTLRSVAMYLGVCDGNMQEGSLRADLNVSVRKKGSQAFGTRTETKNLNSIRFLGQAVEFEMRRQIMEIESGRNIVQETRLWDSNKKESRSMRSKEEAHDYRYFPDPDLLPLIVDEKHVQKIASSRPELAHEKAKRFCEQLGLTAYDAKVLTQEKELADYFESALVVHNNAKAIANWVINDVLRIVKSHSSDDELGAFSCKIPSQTIAGLVKLIDDRVISGKIAKQVFEILVDNPTRDPADIVKENNWVVETDVSAIQSAIAAVIASNPDEVAKFKSGKQQVFGFLMGEVMKRTQGKADPKETSRLLRELLS